MNSRTKAKVYIDQLGLDIICILNCYNSNRTCVFTQRETEKRWRRNYPQLGKRTRVTYSHHSLNQQPSKMKMWYLKFTHPKDNKTTMQKPSQQNFPSISATNQLS